MSALDFGARAMAAGLRRTARRLSTIDRLSTAIARNLPAGIPPVMASPMAENRSATTQIATGTLYGFDYATPAATYKDRYTLYGGTWDFWGTAWPQTLFQQAWAVHAGDGSSPSANYSAPPATVRFMTQADRLEIYCHNYLGFRLKVNGQYAKAGLYGCAALNGDASGAPRYFLFDFGSSAQRTIEIEGEDNFRFGGVRIANTYAIYPCPDASGLCATVHGDSMPTTIVDSNDNRVCAWAPRTSQLVSTLTGIRNMWQTNIGGVGFVANGSGTKSNFIAQAPLDFPAGRFDVIWQFSGKNDYPVYGSQAAFQAVVKNWLDIVIGNSPDAIVVMGGPLVSGSGEAYNASAAATAIQNAKKAACAQYPRNCAFIETIGNAARPEPWVFGTGRQGATTGNGIADLAIGSDGTHPTIFGHVHQATRMVQETARVLPNLRSRIQNGVIAGVNDMDLV